VKTVCKQFSHLGGRRSRQGIKEHSGLQARMFANLYAPIEISNFLSGVEKKLKFLWKMPDIKKTSGKKTVPAALT